MLLRRSAADSDWRGRRDARRRPRRPRSVWRRSCRSAASGGGSSRSARRRVVPSQPSIGRTQKRLPTRIEPSTNGCRERRLARRQQCIVEAEIDSRTRSRCRLKRSAVFSAATRTYRVSLTRDAPACRGRPRLRDGPCRRRARRDCARGRVCSSAGISCACICAEHRAVLGLRQLACDG